ncbi:MAG: SpoIIIAH-like family protein [Clostridia bacterium]|nr:SpoIIIAH-like family protein [Clostridia bacterium]
MKVYVVKRPRPLRFLVLLALVLLALAYLAATWRVARETLGGPTAGAPAGSEPGVLSPGEVLVRGASEAGGEASLPALAPAGDFFVEARLERDRERAEKGRMLQAIVDDPQSTAQAREVAESELVELAQAALAEGQAEAILKAKGYKDALVILTGKSATVVLQTAGISAADAAVAADAVAQAAGLPREAVNVVAHP